MIRHWQQYPVMGVGDLDYDHAFQIQGPMLCHH